MVKAIENISKELIYEIVDGQPVFYQGYKEVINNSKTLDEVMGSSSLQSFLINELVFLINTLIDRREYQVMTSELGLVLSKNDRRSIDISIYSKADFKGTLFSNSYQKIPPKVVIEIDTKADRSQFEEPFGYYQHKTHDLLAFGVEKVIWVFTELKMVMVATLLEDWVMIDWKKDIEVMENINFNIEAILKNAQ